MNKKKLLSMFNLKKILGKNLKTLRQNSQLTQEELGALIKIEHKMISKIETGSSFASAQTIEDLCKVFKILPENLFKANFEINKQDIKTKKALLDSLFENLEYLDKETIEFLTNVIYSILNNYDKTRIKKTARK